MVGGPRAIRPLALALAALAALLAGVSRPMLGVHSPSDVIAGWSFGLLWILLMLRLSEWIRPSS